MFYRATVENNIDPESFGRVQVRVYGIHDEGSGVSTADLPWAEVSGGTDFGLVNGIGVTSVLRIGTMVWVFFNNDDYNYPVVFATIKGSSDINDVAKGSYTNVATLKTASGHIIELGDAAGAERIKITHKTGTSILIDSEGSIIINGVKDNTFNLVGNSTETITGNFKETISGNFEETISGSTKSNTGGTSKITAGTIYLN